MIIEKYKICKRCNVEKSYDNFFKNKNCKFGINPSCKNCCKDAKASYILNNKQKIKDSNKKSYEKNKEHHSKIKKIYYLNNKEKINNSCKEYYYKNKKQIINNHNIYQKNKCNNDLSFYNICKLRNKNKNNLKKAIKYYLEGKTDKLPSKSPSRLLLKLYEIQNNTCPYCNNDMVDNIHIDHIIPLSKNGSNEIENLILCCANCNLSKSAKDLDVWLKQCNINCDEFILNIEERNKAFFNKDNL